MTEKSSLAKQIASLAAGPLLCLVILNCPVPDGLSEAGLRHLAAAAWVLVWWISAVFPLAAVSLLSLPIYGIVNVMPPAKAFAIYGNPNLMLLLGAMLILAVWKESGLIARYTYWVLTRPWINGRPKRLMFAFAFATGLVSTIVPNIPVAILFVSLAVGMGRSIGAEPGQSNGIRSLCVMSGVGSALGGAGTPLGGAPNLVVIGVIASALHHDVSFAEWTAMGMPMCLLMLLAMVLLAYIFFPTRPDGIIGDSVRFIREKHASLGPVSRLEHLSICLMLAAILLWVVGQPLAKSLGWATGVRLFAPPSVALLIGSLVFCLPVGRKGENGELQFGMSWKKCVESIDWSILIFTGGAILFGENLVNGGIDKWLGALLINSIGDMPPLLIWFSIMILGAFLAQIIVNLAVVGFFIPVTATVAVHYGLNPVVVCLTVGIICNVGIMFPFSSVPIAAAMVGSEGYSSPRDYIFYGLAVLVVCSLIALGCGALLGDLVFPSVAAS